MSVISFHGYPHDAEPKRKPRSVSITALPPRRWAGWSSSTLAYLDSHHVCQDIQQVVENIYPTVIGICFLLDGPFNFQIRMTEPNAIHRFYTPPSSPIRQNLFIPKIGKEYLNQGWQNVVVVVEGTTDALAVAQHGVQSVAMLGAIPTQEKFNLLEERFPCSRWKRVLVPDSDVAGASLVGKFLEYLVPVVVVHLPDTVKDFCDLTIKEQVSFLHSMRTD